MRKAYIAFVNASQMSGIVTYDDAVKWATKLLNNNRSVTKVHIAHVKDTVFFEEQPVKVVEFEAELPAEKPHPHARTADFMPSAAPSLKPALGEVD